jgi:hypothetical protein
LPTVITRTEVRKLLLRVHGTPHLISPLLYGAEWSLPAK